MTREDIRNEIRRLVNDTDTDTTRQRHTDAAINSRIDWVNEDIVAKTLCLPSRITNDLTAATAEITLPDDFLFPTDVWRLDGSDWVPLGEMDIPTLDHQHPAWQSLSGNPSVYYIRRNKIGLVPYPSATISGGLRIDFIQRPDALGADGSFPFNGVTKLYPYHYNVVLGVTYKVLYDEAKNEQADRFFGMYNKEIKDMKKFIGERPQGTARIRNIYEQVMWTRHGRSQSNDPFEG